MKKHPAIRKFPRFSHHLVHHLFELKALNVLLVLLTVIDVFLPFHKLRIYTSTGRGYIFLEQIRVWNCPSAIQVKVYWVKLEKPVFSPYNSAVSCRLSYAVVKDICQLFETLKKDSASSFKVLRQASIQDFERLCLAISWRNMDDEYSSILHQKAWCFYHCLGYKTCVSKLYIKSTGSRCLLNVAWNILKEQCMHLKYRALLCMRGSDIDLSSRKTCLFPGKQEREWLLSKSAYGNLLMSYWDLARLGDKFRMRSKLSMIQI